MLDLPAAEVKRQPVKLLAVQAESLLEISEKYTKGSPTIDDRLRAVTASLDRYAEAIRDVLTSGRSNHSLKTIKAEQALITANIAQLGHLLNTL